MSGMLIVEPNTTTYTVELAVHSLVLFWFVARGQPPEAHMRRLR